MAVKEIESSGGVLLEIPADRRRVVNLLEADSAAWLLRLCRFDVRRVTDSPHIKAAQPQRFYFFSSGRRAHWLSSERLE
jgi:hypothetical protein